MAEETQRYRIEVVVDPKPGVQGVDTVEKRLVSLETAADRLRRLLRNLFFFAGLGTSIRQLFELADAYTRIENRIRLVTKSDAERTVVLQKLFEVSNRVRIGTQQVAELYVRTALSAKTLGRSQQELLNFSESVSQALLLSGASAQEANNGLIQLSQGISANRLGGDELRSVLEQLPAVADVIAQQLGITRGQLRAAGAEGRISAETILDAFKRAREELANNFAKTIPTIGQSFQVLRNRLTEYVGTSDRVLGISQQVSRAILVVSENIDLLARSVVGLSVALGITLVDAGIQRASRALLALGRLAVTNPLAIIGGAATLAIGALVAFGDQVQLSTDRLANLQDFAIEAVKILGELFAPLIDDAIALADSFIDLDDTATTSVESIIRRVAFLADAMLGFFRGTFNAIVVIWDGLPGNFKFIADVTANIFRAMSDTIVRYTLANFQTLIVVSKQTGSNLKQVVENYISAIAAAAKGNGEAAESFLTNADDAASRLSTTLSSFPDKVRGELAKLSGAEFFPQEEIVSAGIVTGEQVAIAFQSGFINQNNVEKLIDETFDRAEERAKKRAADQARDAAARAKAAAELDTPGASLLNITDSQLELIRELNGTSAELIKRQSDLNFLIEHQDELQGNLAVTVEQLTRAQDELTIKSLQNATDMESGFKRAFLSLSLEATNFADAAERALAAVADFGTEALVDLARTGGENFKQLADQAVQELQRIIARLIVVNLLKATGEAIGGPIGGIIAGAASGGKAAGGTVQPDRSYLVGEKGPELFQPRQTGSIVPNSALSGPAKPPQVNVQVVNVSNPDEIPQAIEAGGADRAILNVLGRNKGAAAQILGR